MVYEAEWTGRVQMVGAHTLARTTAARANRGAVRAQPAGHRRGRSRALRSIELQLHYAITRQSGKAMATVMVRSTHADWRRPWLARAGRPHHDATTLWRLELHHRHLLNCIVAAQPEAAMVHTRAHDEAVRQQVQRALSA